MPEGILVLHNVGKSQNFGQLLRSASAFGISEVAVCGAPKLQTFGSFGTSDQIPTRKFINLSDSINFYREQNEKVCVLGIEITENSIPL